MNALTKFYRKDRHIARLVFMTVIWLVFMAITKFDKFYTIANFQTIAGKFPEFGIMSLGAKKGTEVEFTFEGEDEAAACEAISKFMQENL